MGEAKRRGTFEQRRVTSIAKRAQGEHTRALQRDKEHTEALKAGKGSTKTWNPLTALMAMLSTSIINRD